MKTIYLLRHAKAVAAEEASTPDSDRPLHKDGKKEAKAMAKAFAAKVMLPDLLITSPAKRAVATARLFAKELGYKKKKIVRDEKLYTNDSAGMLNLVKELTDSADSVMIVGHNPAISEFAALLSQSVKDELASGGLLGIKFDARKWREIKQGEGEVIYNNFPDLQKKREARYQDYQAKLEDELSQAVSASLQKIHSGTADKLEKKIRKASRALAKKFVKRLRSDGVDIDLGNGKSRAAKTRASTGASQKSGGRKKSGTGKRNPKTQKRGGRKK